MRPLALAVALTASCVTAGLDGARPGGGGAMLSEYIADVRETNSVGVIAKDLSGSAVDIHDLKDPSRTGATNEAPGVAFGTLGFAGATDDTICLLDREHLETDDSTPAETLLKTHQDELAASPLWLAAVDSLGQVGALAPWPPIPGAVRLTTITALGDEQTTVVEKKSQPDGGYVEVKHDWRIVSFGVCGPRPAIKPTTRFLIAVNHASANPPTTIEPHQFDTEQNKRSRMSKDVMFVWALTDDPSTIDLSK